ncbi:MAG TPA: ABC transporter permease subunit, partial [bacterium]|nr:ABC transporter permease subunit [bacterium]
LLTSAMTRTSGIAIVVSYLLGVAYLFGPLVGQPFLPAGFENWFIHVALFHVLNDKAFTLYPWWNSALLAVVAGTACSFLASVFLVSPRAVGKLLDRTSIGSRQIRKSRPVWSHPVLWREIYCGGGRRVTTFLNVSTAASVACFFAAAFVKNDTARYVLGAVTMILPAIAGGVLGATSVSLEKEGGSIAALLLMPSSATSVVVGKFAGACARTLPLAGVPFLLGFVRLEPLWMWGSLSSALVSTLLIATGVLFSTLFAKSAVSVAFTFGGTVIYGFCCCNVFSIFPMMVFMPVNNSSDQVARWVMFGVSCVTYGLAIVTVLGIAVGFFEQRARDAA